MSEISEPLRRALRAVEKHGAAERIYRTTQTHDWSWVIAGVVETRQVNQAIIRGWLVGVGTDRDRVVLTDRGRALLRQLPSATAA
jgi:hypothetical protein